MLKPQAGARKHKNDEHKFETAGERIKDSLDISFETTEEVQVGQAGLGEGRAHGALAPIFGQACRD